MTREHLEQLIPKMLPMPPLPLLAGISGGADSVALFHLLCLLREKQGLRFEVIHVNHGLRGAASDGDEAFVRELCVSCNVPFTACRPDLRGRRDENTSRTARYACFRERLEACGAGALVLAHHRDDQTETFLLHLLRGAGAEGLAGMQPDAEVFGIRVLRPLLELSRAELRDALSADGLTWREDASNGDAAYARNALRSDFLPAMERLFPGAGEHIAHAASALAVDSSWLEARAAEAVRTRAEGPLFRVRGFDSGDAVLIRALRRWWQMNCPALRKEHSLSYAQSVALLDLAGGRTDRVNLPCGVTAVRTPSWLHLKLPGNVPPPAVPFTDGRTVWGEYVLDVCRPDRMPPGPETQPEARMRTAVGDGCRTQGVCREWLASKQLVIRSRRPGDRIRPFGSGMTKKLQDYLVDRHVPAPWRDSIPLLCEGDEVYLVCGVGAGHVPPCDPQRHDNLLLKWSGKCRWLTEKEEGD